MSAPAAAAAAAVSLSGHKRPCEAEKEENLVTKRVRSLDDGEEEKGDGVLKWFEPRDECNLTITTGEGWTIKVPKARVYILSDTFRVLCEEGKVKDTIEVPAGLFGTPEDMLCFFTVVVDQVDPPPMEMYESEVEWVKQFAFFGFDKRVHAILDSFRNMCTLTKNVCYDLGSIYNHKGLLHQAAKEYIDGDSGEDDDATDDMARKMGPALLREARMIRISRANSNLSYNAIHGRHKKLVADSRAVINTFLDSYIKPTECDLDECRRDCAGDSDIHPEPEHFQGTDESDYNDCAVAALGKINAILDRTVYE